MKKNKGTEVNPNSDNPNAITEKIANRNNILKIIVISIFAFLLAYKLLVAEININISDFNFSELLTLTLALFAIGISISFYFKTTDSSNLFYDNTYKFTKDISVILGRIEERFGERLRHLDEGYSGLIDKVSGRSEQKNVEETKKEIDKEKLKLKQDLNERKAIIDDLIEKAKLKEDEKKKIRNQLRDKEKEIVKQNREIQFLNDKIKKSSEFQRLPQTVTNLIINKLMEINNPDKLFAIPMSALSRELKFDIESLTEKEKFYLRRHRIIEIDGTPTVHGIKTILDFAKERFAK